jgi:hypothetical protein
VGDVIVIAAIGIAAITGTLSLSEALAGYSDSTVWLIVAAFLLCRGFIITGLGRRIAFLARARIREQHSQAWLCSNLADAILAPATPSNTARAGGICEEFRQAGESQGDGLVTLANVIEATGKPTLVVAHNKTLAAQLYNEFREFFPGNRVEYFVSYYDYYQPEAYLPQTDTYIEKDADINEEIDRLRLASTSSILSRRDTIIVASVSCIYNIGSPEEYGQDVVQLRRGETRRRERLLRHLTEIFYQRNDKSHYSRIQRHFLIGKNTSFASRHTARQQSDNTLMCNHSIAYVSDV